MKWKTQHNATQFPKDYEKSQGKSLTIPDQSTSVSEMIARFTMGLPMNGARIPIWEGDDEVYPDLNSMDLVERDEYVMAQKDKLDRYNDQQQKRKAAEQAAFDKKIEDEIRKQATARQSLNPVQ